MKVFIRSNRIGDRQPLVAGFYDDNADVPDNIHGEGMTILHVPRSAFVYDRLDGGMLDPMPKLAANWRELAGDSVMAAEAKRRVESVATPTEQAASLHELVELTLKHGTDISKWPQEAKTRKAEIDDAWNYIRAVNERARSKTVPPDPASDKAWPTRIAKK